MAPHPDDESIGCGGLLLKYSDQCDVVVITDGRYGGKEGESISAVINARKKEFIRAIEFVGIKNYQFLDIEDGKLSENFQKFSEIDFTQYDVIICPAKDDNHPDHKAVFRFLQKIQPQSKIFGYEIWSTISTPAHYLDISDVVEKKKELISFHKSQVEQLDYVEKIISLNAYRGMMIYPVINYAEIYQELKF